MSIKFIPASDLYDSARIVVNVDVDDAPFGQIWTWPNTDEERHPWHVKTLRGPHVTFLTISGARAFMRRAAKRVNVNV